MSFVFHILPRKNTSCRRVIQGKEGIDPTLFRCLTIMRNSGGGVPRRPGADERGGGRQERDGQADGVVGADGQEVFEDDRALTKMHPALTLCSDFS